MSHFKLFQSSVFAALCLLGVSMTYSANATLLGDSVTVGHYFPDSATSLSGATPPGTFIVQSGDADIYTFYNSFPYGYRVNVEANSILVDFNYLFEAAGTWADSYSDSCTILGCTTVLASFNGLGVSDLNDSSGNPLQGVVIDTNMAGWDSSRLSFGADNVLFDWKGLSFNSNFLDNGTVVTPATYFNATLTFGGTTAPIPEPEIYAMLGMGLGLLGWVGRRKKLKEAAAA